MTLTFTPLSQEDFFAQRRQQFLTLAHYEDWVSDKNKIISKDLTEDWRAHSKYSSGESRRWGGLGRKYLELFYLHYSAGEAIEPLTALFEQSVRSYENEATEKGLFEGDAPTDRRSILGGSETAYIDGLTYLSLCHLLHRPDLLPSVEVLLYGAGDLRDEDDETDTLYNRLIHFYGDWNNTHITYNSEYVDLSNAFYEQNTKEEALADLTSYLEEWYDPLHTDQDFYESHKDGGSGFYVGYWAFEAAAAVYLLDLDDSSLHKFLYYPKDLVAYARTRRDEVKLPSEIVVQPTILYGRPGERVPHTGKWVVDNFVGFENWLEKDDIFPQGQVSGKAEPTFRDDAVFRFTLDSKPSPSLPATPPKATAKPKAPAKAAEAPPAEIQPAEAPPKPEHPYKGKRFVSGETCPCNGVWQVVDSEKSTLVWANPVQRGLAESKFMVKGNPFPERLVRHTKPREVEVKSGLFSKKTVQEFDYLDRVHWVLSPEEIENYRG